MGNGLSQPLRLQLLLFLDVIKRDCIKPRRDILLEGGALEKVGGRENPAPGGQAGGG